MSRPAPRRRSGRQAGRKCAKRKTSTIIGGIVGAALVLGLAAFLLVRQVTPPAPGDARIPDQGSGHSANQTDQH